MAIVTTDDSHYKAIADTLREYAGEGLEEDFGTDKMLPSEMAERTGYAIERWGSISYGEGMDEGFSEGYSTGYGEGHEEGFGEGKAEGITEGIQTEYDRFWDAYQQNGNRTNYGGAFAGQGWVAENLKPKYDVIVNGQGSQFFYYSGFVGDLAQHFEDLGIRFDTSKMTGAHSFANTAEQITRFPEVNIASCGAANSSLFAYCRALVTIDKLVVAANNAWASTFQACAELQNLTIDGTIGTSGLTLQYSTKLSKASITSVVNALSGTTSGLSVTFSKTAVNAAFSTTEGGTDGSTSAEWTALVNTKTNWTINLV